MEKSFYNTDLITKHYRIDKEIGEGNYSVVVKATKKSTNEDFAIKIIDKTSLSESDAIALAQEVEILINIDHPNVVKLFEVFEDESNFFLVFEMMKGGELFSRIVQKDKFSEKEAAETMRPIIDAIRYCHSMGIVHRDLKPENLLYLSKDPTSILKVSDFGFAKVVDNDMMITQCGTPGYVAPEVLKEMGYGKEVDIWSLGVIIYVLLCGFPPFYDENHDTLFELIKAAKLEFPSPYWDEISEMAKDLIRKIIVADPSKRLTPDEILAHPWIVGEKTPRSALKMMEKLKQYQNKH